MILLVSTHPIRGDRKSTRLNSSHGYISYAVFCLKKKRHIPVWYGSAAVCVMGRRLSRRCGRADLCNASCRTWEFAADVGAAASLVFFFLMIRRPPRSTPFPTRRSSDLVQVDLPVPLRVEGEREVHPRELARMKDRKSTRLNSSHDYISYAVFCLKKKKKYTKKTAYHARTTAAGGRTVSVED